MRHFLRWGVAGALLLLTPGAALAAKTPPKVIPTPKAAKAMPKATSTPKAKAASSISGHITYVGANGNIFVARPDGTDKRALTNNGPTDPTRPCRRPRAMVSWPCVSR